MPNTAVNPKVVLMKDGKGEPMNLEQLSQASTYRKHFISSSNASGAHHWGGKGGSGSLGAFLKPQGTELGCEP